MENIYTSHFKPAIKIPYQQKRESKIHEFSTPKFRGADALKNNEDVIESINVENNKGNHFNDWDFEEADDITIGNTSSIFFWL